MRQITIYFLLLSCIVANGQTSTYHPLPESNAVWTCNAYLYCFPEGGTGDYDYIVAIDGDTLIQNQTYKILEVPFSIDNSTGNCFGLTTGYRGAFRQEIPNKKVYFIPPSETAEQLLFDFTMEVGDTVKGYLATYNPNRSITSIDSVIVGNSYRKRWNVGAGSTINLIEGVGSTFGFFQPLLGVLNHEPSYATTCFQENAITLYPETASECLVVTTVQSNARRKLTPSVFPNPSANAVQLKFGSMAVNLTLNVFSSLGELVSSKRLKDIDSYNLMLPEVRGVYLLQLIDQYGDESVLRVVKE